MKLRTPILIAVALGLAAPALADRDFALVFSSKSVLEAGQEVPVANLPDPTDPDTGSKGLANGIVAINRNATKADVKVTFSNLSGPFTRLHLHCNVRGKNGPIAIGIVDLVAIGQDNSEVATLDSNRVIGTLSNADFPDGDPCADPERGVGRSITSIRDLAEAIQAEEIYFNLHTTAFPAGELRGQVEPLSRVRVKQLKKYDDD